VCSSKLSDWLRTYNSNVLFEIVSSKDDFSEQKDLFSPMSSDVMLNNFFSSADFSDKICKQQRTGRQSFGSSAKGQVPTVDTHVSFSARNARTRVPSRLYRIFICVPARISCNFFYPIFWALRFPPHTPESGTSQSSQTSSPPGIGTVVIRFLAALRPKTIVDRQGKLGQDMKKLGQESGQTKIVEQSYCNYISTLTLVEKIRKQCFSYYNNPVRVERGSFGQKAPSPPRTQTLRHRALWNWLIHLHEF